MEPDRKWVWYDARNDTYNTPDGTHVPAWLVDNVQCLADVLYIAIIRERQREAMRATVGIARDGAQ